MRILVTGGAGFIGSHVSRALIEGGDEVCVLDDLSTGRRENVPDGAGFVEGDICDAATVERVVAGHRPDAISHQAAQASVAVSTREPRRDAEVNVLGTIELLRAACRHGVDRFVFASTGGALYGEVAEGERASSAQRPGPTSPYGCSKLAAEHYVRALGTAHGLGGVVLRYANVYGPAQDPEGEAGVVAIFCRRLLAGESIRVNARARPGDVGCVRDYVFVGDVVDANLAALRGELTTSVLDICSGIGTTTLDLAHALALAIGVTPSIEYGAVRPGDLERSVLDPTAHVRELGSPTPLADGLARTVTWFRERFG